MIAYSTISIFQSPNQTLVNPVNCVGVMGAGLAAKFKERWPVMFDAYKRHCDAGRLAPGKLWLYDPGWIRVLCFPTKRHWKDPSSLDIIEGGLINFSQTYEQRGITSVAFPALGCGCGGLTWRDVKPLMERYLGELPIPVMVHLQEER